MSLNPAEIVKEAIKCHGSVCAVEKETGVPRSTLKRIKNGSTPKPQAATLAKIIRSLPNE
jgi:predicted transcriptional regulator